MGSVPMGPSECRFYWFRCGCISKPEKLKSQVGCRNPASDLRRHMWKRMMIQKLESPYVISIISVFCMPLGSTCGRNICNFMWLLWALAHGIKLKLGASIGPP